MAQGAEGAGGLSCGYEGDHKEAEIQRNQKCVITTENFSSDALRKICTGEKLRTDQMKYAGVKEIENWDNPKGKIQSGSSGFRRKAEHTQGAL